MKYCIDTSALIDAWARWYAPDIMPTLWNRIDNLIEARELISSEEVLKELERKEGDRLYEWAKKRRTCFLPLKADIQQSAKNIIAAHPQLVDGRTGKSFADPWVIATAQVCGSIVVTGETPTRTPHRPKIPDVCETLHIRWINFAGLIREEGWRF